MTKKCHNPLYMIGTNKSRPGDSRS